MNLKELSKMDVVTSDGNVIGKIEGAIVSTKGNVDFLSVKLEKDVVSGLKTKPNLRQDIGVNNIAGITDKLLLNLPLDGLAKHFQPHNEKFDADRLIGMDVTDTKGDSIGTVENMMIAKDTWKIPSIRIKVNSEEREALKMKSIILSGNDIAISLKNVRNVGDMVVLNITSDHLNDILEAPPLRKP